MSPGARPTLTLDASRTSEVGAILGGNLKILTAVLTIAVGIFVFACSDDAPQPVAVPISSPSVASVASTPVPQVAVSTPVPDTPAPAGVEEAIAASDITPFTNVAPLALKDGFEVSNYRPSAVVFDYDNDGDQDLYVTQHADHSNFLYDNQGDGTFIDVSDDAGVDLTFQNSSGAIACDLNNDGYKDLYVGARGIIGDGLDFRSAEGADSDSLPLQGIIGDRLLVNDGDGTFKDVTASALGGKVNLRSASSAACADVNGDGWLDIYVGNAVDEDWFMFDQESHAGHYNVLYLNNRDLTFVEIAKDAGVDGGPIMLRDPDGKPILYTDPDTGLQYEGYDPSLLDAQGNRVADPSGRTHAVLFFDHDDDRDPDLWVANDGHRPYVFRNDSTPGHVQFTPVAEAMGVDKSGNWMGFAVGDYDGDQDLDLFVTNAGFHLRLFEPQEEPGGDCRYTERFDWGTCLHYLLRNDGSSQVEGVGLIGGFVDVAPQTSVAPSPLMPPRSLDGKRIHPDWEQPTGLSAYDFGYGATFFDYDNDGDQDVYWLGSEGPPGKSSFPAAGRMLRGDGKGSFEDITVRAQMLDILDVDYSILDADDPSFNPDRQRISSRFHLNGKALAHADLNGDGYLDLVGTNSSGPVWDSLTSSWEPMLGPVFVWMNGGGDNHWISLHLKGRMGIDGTGSNSDAVGARVYLTTGGHTQVQEVRAGSSYLSMDSIELEFGLGDSESVDEIRVLWPSGRDQILEGVDADQVLVITEPDL